MSEVWTHLIRPMSGCTAATPPPHTRVVDVSDKAKEVVNAVEIRAIVERLVRQGRILKPAPTPTERRAKLNVPSEKRTLVNTALNVIRCDQCGTRFKKKCSVHLRCSRECSRKANLESVRVWHVERGLRGVEHGPHDCDQCGVRFQKKTRGHRFCTAECRVLGIGKLRSNINAMR